jgi:hypothetical protein
VRVAAGVGRGDQADEPALVAGRFAEGALADATLAAYADLLATRIGVARPAWVFAATRIAPEPWFAVNGPRSRLLALRDSPPEFKRRNLFTPAHRICRCGCARGVHR